MEFLGDLERAFAAFIYPNRVLIAILALIAVAALAIVAWRRRWDLAARRHPTRTIVTVLAAAVILGPIGWYLGSPLFLSSTVDEPAPIASGSSSPSPGTVSPPSQSGEPSAAPTGPSEPPPSLLALAGTFKGADEFHFGEGTARLIETAPGTFVVRLEDFAVRNGPDLFVYLSPSSEGYADGAIELGRLKADRGNQNYETPAGVDVGDAASVVIWCKQFSVEFAAAPLE